MANRHAGRQRRQAECEEHPDCQQGQAAADDPLQELRAVAGLAHSLSVQLRECWPVQGQGQPIFGPPTNFTQSDLYRHLLHLKTLLFRFHPPTDPAETVAWLKSRMPLLTPDVADAVGRVKLVCDHLTDQFGMQAALSTVDGHFKAVLTPTLNTARLWQPPDGRPIPEIDAQDIGALEWAAARLYQALEEKPALEAITPAQEIGAGQEKAREEQLPATEVLRQGQRIPPEQRTIPLSLTQAAKLMGYTRTQSGARIRDPKGAAEILRRSIEDGTIRAERRNRQSYVFDRSDFPREVWPRILPPSPPQEGS
jgi:hypothetical protein